MKRKKLDEEKEKIQILWLIFIVPIIFFVLDLVNLGHFCFPYIDNLTNKYDWLSFIGTYSGAIVSAIFLLIITQKDRRDNNKILRESQRPYLDVNWTILKADFIKENMNNLNRQLFMYNNWGRVDAYDNANEFLTLEIKNTGASTAIIDVNKSKFELEYNRYVGTVDGKDKTEKQVKEVSFKSIVKRKSIAAGESMFIVCNSIEFYNIRTKTVEKNTYIKNIAIYYKDLFNYNYEDICKFDNGKLIPEKDNEIIIK